MNLNLNVRLAVAALFVVPVVAACGPPAPEDQTLTGPINGEDWTAGAGIVSFSDDADVLSGSVFAEGDAIACGSDTTAATFPQLLMSVPRKEGVYELNFNLFDLANAHTFTVVTGPGENLIISEGVLTVEDLTDTTARVGIVSRAEDALLNGYIEFSFCDKLVDTVE